MDPAHISFDATYATDDSDEIKSRYKIICRYPLVLQVISSYSIKYLDTKERYYMVDTILAKNEYMIGNMCRSYSIGRSIKPEKIITICTNKRLIKLMPEIDDDSDIHISFKLADIRTVVMTESRTYDAAASNIYIYRYDGPIHRLSVCRRMGNLALLQPDIRCPIFDHEIPLQLISFITNLYKNDYGIIKQLLKSKKDIDHPYEIKKLESDNLSQISEPEYKVRMVEFKHRIQDLLDKRCQEIAAKKEAENARIKRESGPQWYETE